MSAELLSTVLPYTTVLKFSREESAVMAEALGIAGEDLCTAM